MPMVSIRGLLPFVLVAALACTEARADVLLSRPQTPAGGLIPSAWTPPDGADADIYAWDSFSLASAATITEIQWQGDGNGSGVGFTITINGSPAIPDQVGVLARYQVPGNAGQTPAGFINGTQRYTYHYVLATPLQVAAGTTYWINIEGTGGWGSSQGDGGSGSHFSFYVGLQRFLPISWNPAMTLIGTSACASPAITTQPSSAAACASGANNAVFSTSASGSGALGYRWQIEAAPSGSNNWTDLSDGPLPGSAAVASGCLTSTLTVSNADSVAAARYRCGVSNACGAATSNPATLSVCYANCDCSTTAPTLNVLDFSCFLNKFAAGDPYANCDRSTTAPVLNVLDFSCFLNKFAAGCS